MVLRIRQPLGQATGLFILAVFILFLFGWREGKPPNVLNLPSSSPQSQHISLSPKHHLSSYQSSSHLSPPSTQDPRVESLDDQEEFREQEVVPLDPQENDLLYRPPLDLAFIFTHARDNYALQAKLRVAVGSLLRPASAPLRLHLITDEDGFHIASEIITQVQAANQLDLRYVKVIKTLTMMIITTIINK